jgi:hypothetical protein
MFPRPRADDRDSARRRGPDPVSSVDPAIELWAKLVCELLLRFERFGGRELCDQLRALLLPALHLGQLSRREACAQPLDRLGLRRCELYCCA